MVLAFKQEYIEHFVAFHLGLLKHQFDLGELDENLIEIADETSFIINYDNEKTLVFKGDKHVKYADVVFGGIGMTMIVKVTRRQGAKITAPFGCI
jgi:hypothetical protein